MEHSLHDLNKHKFTDEEIEFIDAATEAHNTHAALEPPSRLLFGLLQKLQTDLNIDDMLASKIIILVQNKTIDEMHNVFETSSFYAGAAWYSRELAKLIYEYHDDDVGDQNV